jgi:outer membrane usher protein
MELGQVTSRSEVLDSIGIKGIHLYNDKRMDPHDGRYVPVINGVANSNAKLPYDSSRASSMKPPFPQVLLL